MRGVARRRGRRRGGRRRRRIVALVPARSQRTGALVRQALGAALRLAALQRGPSVASDSHVGEALTAREKEVLHLICAGYSNREIADLLALAEGTVKNHVSNLLLKLDARDRTQAALKALQQGQLG